MVLLGWKPYLMTYRMDRTHEEVAAVVESDCRFKIPNTASVFLGTVGLLGCLCYFAVFGHFNGEITIHFIRLFLMLLLGGLLFAPRVHWTSAVIATIAGFVWICLGLQYAWPWYFYTLDVLSAALVLALLFYGYADWHYGKPHRFLYVANGELVLVSPDIEFFERMRVSNMQEEKVLLEEPLEWIEDFEGFVLRLPIESSGEKLHVHFRLGTNFEIDYLKEQGIAIKKVEHERSPFISYLKHDLKYSAGTSLACVLGLIILPVELQLYDVAITGMLPQYKSGRALPMYQALDKSTRLHPYSSILFSWKAIAASELGRYEIACKSYERALRLSGEDGEAGKLIRRFTETNGLRFSQRATRLPKGSYETVTAYLANYRELNPEHPRPESLLKQAIELLETSREERSRALLIRLRGYIEFRRYLVHSNLFEASAESRLEKTIALANEFSDTKTLARIYFNYDHFNAATRVLQGSVVARDRILLASAGRYMGKREEELIALIEPLCQEKQLGFEARLLKALILAQYGKVTEARKMLQGENNNAAKLLSALVCSQQASRVLDKALVNSHLNTIACSYYKPSDLPIVILKPDDDVLAELCRFEWMSSVDLEHLVALTNKRGFNRLSKTEWYPYRLQADILVQNSAD